MVDLVENSTSQYKIDFAFSGIEIEDLSMKNSTILRFRKLKLIKKAQAECLKMGHKLGRFRHEYPGATAICKVCGCHVHISPSRAIFIKEICGSAITTICEGI